MNAHSFLLRFSAALLFLLPLAGHAETAREIIAKAMVTEDAEEQAKLIGSLTGSTDADIPPLLNAWKRSNLYIYEVTEGEGDNAKTTRTAVQMEEKVDAEGKQRAHRISDDKLVTDAKGAPLPLLVSDLMPAETDSALRSAMKGVLDLLSLASADAPVRRNAVSKLGMSQDPAFLAPLLARQGVEKDPTVLAALREGVDLIRLKSENPQEQIAAAQDLARIGSLPSEDFLTQLAADAPKDSPVAVAAGKALGDVRQHKKWVNFFGTLFRSLSLGSVLLVIAIGLAITFGLMGVINMAHGELIAVGAYATYVVQNLFADGLEIPMFGLGLKIPGFHAGPGLLSLYFVIAIPVSFGAAALVGLALERGVIRFLYRRPLESLLATWGVSLVMQQLLRLMFGSNNVQVYSPSWLSGNWTVFDVIFGWNRVFVIGFAVAIVLATYLLLTRTPLGLLIRAVMQNRAMAACMGVRTERVNMMTFSFGSGLAGLAGAFLSQIGNVGPSMGQDHIVNAFMTVVVGGVGSLAGTVISAIGIGVADQTLQTTLSNPVMGKILVLVTIILFLQWKPAGLFVTKSRSLES